MVWGMFRFSQKKERGRQKIVEMRQCDTEKAGEDRKNFPKNKRENSKEW